MFRLLSAGAYKYMRSPATWAMIAAAPVTGAVCGLMRITELGLDELTAVCPVLLSAVLAVLNFGTEYDCGTLRNKLTVGVTKTKIFFSELVMAAAETAIIYLLFGAGFAAVCFRELLNMNIRAAARIIPLMLLCGVVITEAGMFVCALTSHRASAVTVFLAVMFALFTVGEFASEYAWEHGAEAELYGKFAEVAERAELDPATGEFFDPMTGIAVDVEALSSPRPGQGVLSALKCVYMAVPTSAMGLYAHELEEYIWGSPNKYDLYPRALPAVTLAELALLALGGAAVFGRKDVR